MRKQSPELPARTRRFSHSDVLILCPFGPVPSHVDGAGTGQRGPTLTPGGRPPLFASGAGTLRRMMTSADRLLITGTRDELIAELGRLGEGWLHLGKPDNAADAARGIEALIMGGTSVRVGHASYEVTES